jgi:2-dehydropantoate 2-reductase
MAAALILGAMRFIIYGAGAIGGGIGGKLHAAGHDTVLIARGAHLEAMRDRGLILRTPDETTVQDVQAASHPGEIEWRAGEVVILAMKSQDTQAALEALRDAAGDVPVVCAQNGVANERMAARLFSHAYGMVVWMPATCLEPGEVIVHSAPAAGLLDCGRYPSGTDIVISEVAAALTHAGFVARPDAAIMRMKYAKLLTNLANTVQALCGTAPAGTIVTRLRDEALMAYEAAGIDSATVEDLRGLTDQVSIRPVPGVEMRAGGSTWQSLTTGRPLETDYLNGEISLLGTLHGVPTPVNRMVQAAAAEAVRLNREPGSYTVEELLGRIDETVASG